MTLLAKMRRLYWKHIRDYDGEICGCPDRHLHGVIQLGCGRPVGVVWHASTGIWNYIVTGQDQTTYTIREGAAAGCYSVEECAEGAGGVLCLDCFHRFARERGIHLCWESKPLDRYR